MKNDNKPFLTLRVASLRSTLALKLISINPHYDPV